MNGFLGASMLWYNVERNADTESSASCFAPIRAFFFTSVFFVVFVAVLTVDGSLDIDRHCFQFGVTEF